MSSAPLAGDCSERFLTGGESTAAEVLGKVAMEPRCQQQLCGLHVCPATESDSLRVD